VNQIKYNHKKYLKSKSINNSYAIIKVLKIQRNLNLSWGSWNERYLEVKIK